MKFMHGAVFSKENIFTCHLLLFAQINIPQVKFPRISQMTKSTGLLSLDTPSRSVLS